MSKRECCSAYTFSIFHCVGIYRESFAENDMAFQIKDVRRYSDTECTGCNGWKEYFSLVEEIYSEYPELPGFLLVDHGLVAVGKDAINAEHTAELIEETAQIAILKATVSKLGL